MGAVVDGAKPGAGASGAGVTGAGVAAGASELEAGAADLTSSPFEHAASKPIDATIAIIARCVRVFSIIRSFLFQRRLINLVLTPVRLAVQQRD